MTQYTYKSKVSRQEMAKVITSKLSRLEINLPNFHGQQQFCLYKDTQLEAHLLETRPTNCAIETFHADNVPQPNTDKIASLFHKRGGGGGCK